MHIDIKSKNIDTVRNTYSHVARRVGDKPASRYQEATFDLQSTTNFHYRPTWQPEYELYDERRTAIKMSDWYKLLDPRQYYYGTYVIARSKLQETADQNFKFVEKRGLLELMPGEVKEKVFKFIVPLRHYCWAANMNNTQICAMGYGTAITAPAMFHAGDDLGIAQYITKIGLLLAENDTNKLDEAKEAWLSDPLWQGVRKAVEDSLVMDDWFQLFVVQNFVMDGLIHPLLFDRFEQQLNQEGGTAQSMLTEFMSSWYAESSRWVDAQIKVAAAESEENAQLLRDWINHSIDELTQALTPIADTAFVDGADQLQACVDDLKKRAQKAKLEL